MTRSSIEIDLAWINGTDPQTAIGIERSPDDVTFSLIATLGAAAMAYQDHTLLPSTIYYYRIRAFNGSSASSYSPMATATTQTPAWVMLSPGTPAPSVRANVGATFAPPSGSMIVCAGDDVSFPATNTQTWALNNSGSALPTWTQIGIAANPGVRTLPGVTYCAATPRYSPASHAVIFFGGLDQSDPSNVVFKNDVWVLDPTHPGSWAPVVTAGTPPAPRFGHAVAMAGSTLYVIGGQNGNPYPNNLMNDVWSLDFSSPTPFWTNLFSSGPLAPRGFHTAIYDSGNNQIVVFGGSDGTNLRNDTWALHLTGTPFWSQILTTGASPSARSFCTATYHSVAQLMVVFGGNALGGSVNDAWILTLDGPPAWIPLAVAGTPPGPRGGHGAALNEADNRMNVFGGQDFLSGTLYPETWKLQF